MLEIDIWPPAKEFIESISSKHARQLITRIERLADNPFVPKSKILEGYAPLRRFRSGDYRIIPSTGADTNSIGYLVDGNVLKVPLIDKRGDDKIYRRMEQKFRK